MHIDFDINLLLVPLLLLFLVIWLLDKLVLKQRAAVRSGARKSENAIISWSYDWPVIALIIVVRSFILDQSYIPSGSMEPTLLTNDYILVNKFNYGLRLPITNTKILNIGEPKRGEIAIFRDVEDPTRMLIKRVIGLPGDHLVFDEGVLSINGKRIETIPQPELTDGTEGQFSAEQMGTHQHLIRQVPGTLLEDPRIWINQIDGGKYAGSMGRHWEVTVPQGEYFMMGDNRDNSADSRFWGFLPEKNLMGRAFYIWMHKDSGWHWPSFSRNGSLD